jgi:hypothetical protein
LLKQWTLTKVKDREEHTGIGWRKEEVENCFKQKNQSHKTLRQQSQSHLQWSFQCNPAEPSKVFPYYFESPPLRKTESSPFLNGALSWPILVDNTSS